MISEALLLRSVNYRDTDVVATFLTERTGKLGAMARGARKGSRRFGGALEPFHTLEVTLDDPGGDLAVLREARLMRVRPRISQNLEAVEAAGKALRWIRHICPTRTPEPAAWTTLLHFLDELDRVEVHPKAELTRVALRLLVDIGFGLELECCVKCGKPCPEGRPACINPAAGGLVCQACGGAPRILGPEIRRMAQGIQRREPVSLSREQADDLLSLADVAFASHTGFEP